MADRYAEDLNATSAYRDETAKAPEREITREIGRIEKAVGRLNDGIDKWGAVLQPVLSHNPEPDQGVQASEAHEAPSSPHGERLASLANLIENATDRIASLTRRTQV